MSLQTRQSRDHPRLRGEHVDVSGLTRNQQGSSPPARGALGNNGASTEADRIIPACAGSTTAGGSQPSTPVDHPRRRGEHQAPHPARRTGVF